MEHLFLTGASGVGKSALLRQLFSPFSHKMAGFLVQRLTEDDRQAGFRACRLDGSAALPPAAAVFRPGEDGVFIDHRQPRPEALVPVIRQAERDAARPDVKLVLLDEIGGVELMLPEFMEPLHRLLSGPVPCAGVLKCRENLARAAENLGLGPGYEARRGELEALIRQDGRLLTMTAETGEEIRNTVMDFARQIFEGEIR